MHQENWRFDALAALREDVAAIRATAERLQPRREALDVRMLRLENRRFQTILAVLGPLAAAFAAIVAAILG